MIDLIKRNFPDFEDDLIKFIAEKGVIKEYKEGEILLRTGQYFSAIMLILDGKIKLYRQADEGEEFFVYYIDPGNACALSMVCASKSEQSEVTAKCFNDTRLIAIPIENMDYMMKNFTSWYHFVLATYRSRFEELLQTIDAIAFHGMDQRLEDYLVKQIKTYKSYELPLKHHEIANDLNSSREVISRLLKKMEQEKLIYIHRNLIEFRTAFLHRHKDLKI